jgi:hypothetical protein
VTGLESQAERVVRNDRGTAAGVHVSVGIGTHARGAHVINGRVVSATSDEVTLVLFQLFR